MTAPFWTLAAALIAAGVGFLVWPLVRGAPPERPDRYPDRRSASLAAHRARLAEIETNDRDRGANIEEARADVARSLLRDLAGGAPPAGEPAGRRAAGLRPRPGAAITLGVALSLLAIGIYTVLGEPRGLAPPAVRDAEAIAQVVGRLLAEAETLARENRNRLEGTPARLIERALALAPDHRKALWFAAIAALHEERPEEARAHLDRLRSLAPLDGEEARIYDQLMNEVTNRRRGR